MEVTIGVQMAHRELLAKTSATAEEVKQALTEALETRGIFVLRDEKGGTLLVPSDKIAYVELGRDEQRRVGFSA